MVLYMMLCFYKGRFSQPVRFVNAVRDSADPDCIMCVLSPSLLKQWYKVEEHLGAPLLRCCSWVSN